MKNAKNVKEMEHACISCTDKKFMGPSCKETCENCPGSICDIDGKCVDQISKCEGGNYYGQKCENECNSNCFECNRQGECISCPENKSWGKNCDKSCANCIGGTCNFEDGICDKALDICAGSVNYGENCNIPCNTEDRPNCLKCYKEHILEMIVINHVIIALKVNALLKEYVTEKEKHV